MRRAIQLIEEFGDKQNAEACLDAFTMQDGYLGGRILPPNPSKGGWRVQAFFEDESEWNPYRDDARGWLPDGMRHVLIPDGLERALGIEVPDGETRCVCRHYYCNHSDGRCLLSGCECKRFVRAGLQTE